MPSGSDKPKEKRPRYLETQCRGCGEIMRQDWNKMQASEPSDKGSRRRYFCSKACERKVRGA